ncbi:ATP-binding protein [bacterium]|nr:ATP-binding protein [bacterium]
MKGETGAGTDDIVLTEIDIDNLIRTKGAIFAGIMTLCKGVGIQPQEIERVVIAGAFGKHLDVNNAIRIGMLPDLDRKHFEYIGNGSLQGASMALLSQRLWQEMQDIADRVTYFELSSWPGYMDDFMAALFLPHTDGGLFPSVLVASG